MVRSGWNAASMQALDLQGVQVFFFQTRSAILQTYKNEQRIVLNQGCERCRGGMFVFSNSGSTNSGFLRVGKPRNHSHECHDVLFYGLAVEWFGRW